MHFNMRENIVIISFKSDRKHVVACHKAGVMKLGDGFFIKIASEIAKKYP